MERRAWGGWRPSCLQKASDARECRRVVLLCRLRRWSILMGNGRELRPRQPQRRGQQRILPLQTGPSYVWRQQSHNDGTRHPTCCRLDSWRLWLRYTCSPNITVHCSNGRSEPRKKSSNPITTNQSKSITIELRPPSRPTSLNNGRQQWWSYSQPRGRSWERGRSRTDHRQLEQKAYKRWIWGLTFRATGRIHTITKEHELKTFKSWRWGELRGSITERLRTERGRRWGSWMKKCPNLNI